MCSTSIFQFDIKKINVNSSQLNPECLEECNRLALMERMKNPASQAEIIDEVKSMVEKAFPNDIKNLDVNNEHIQKVLDWSLDHISNLNQLVEKDFAFLWIIPATKKHNLSKGNPSVI